ncbi:MAG: PAS domain S-box protein [Verrucomicrobiota bacterium]
MKRAFLLIAVIVALAATSIFLRQKAGEFSDDQHNGFQTALWQIKHLDITFNEDLLAARFALLDNYDDFQTRTAQMQQSLEVLTKPPAFITSIGQQAIAQARKKYLGVLEKRQKLFERFKTQNAATSNSRRYLPVALEELARRLQEKQTKTPDDLELQAINADLSRLILNRLSTSDATLEQAQLRMQQFKDWCIQHPQHPEAHFAASLARHAQIILSGQGEVDALTYQLMALPTAEAIQDLFDAYQTEVTSALGRTQQYRALLYMLGLVTLIILGYGFKALSAANLNLEQRVRERTADLEAEVAERKTTEEKLRETLQSLAAINNVLDRACIIARTDRQGNITYANDNFCRISGYSREELLNQNHRILKSSDHSDTFFKEMWKTIASGEVWHGEIKNIAKNGTAYWVNTTIGPMLDEQGKPKGFMAIRTDITERKRIETEVAQVNRQLIEASRQAGMAEVATGVLHNVGNVLNSVNVSATLVTDSIQASKVSSLPKVVALLDAHTANLGQFFTSDPKGTGLPHYLRQLSTHLTQEQQRVLEELSSLRKNVEHIKDIVAMQQSFAKVCGVSETIHVTELIEDAIRMNNVSLQRHAVSVRKDLPALPPINVDKHKALQILVNLIRNAKHACNDSGRDDKQLVISAISSETAVKISVADNGVGIPAENLNRIFNHGFTTKKAGHGFGLHSGANAAREMGGTLTVQSDGVGKGAIFTVELPFQPPQKVNG